MTRTAAGRRALQVAVLVGGLFVFGFLCGERAHAAEGAPPVPGQVQRQVQDQVLRVTDALTEPVEPVVPSAGEDTVDKVVQPVGGLVETVTEELAEVSAEVPTLPVLPDLPDLPVLPGVPASPTVPSSPAAPVSPASPASPASPTSPSLPEKTLPTTVLRTHQGGVAYGPRFAVRSVVDSGSVAQGGVRVSRATVRQAPGGLPGGMPNGALGERAVVDAGGSRHGGGHGDAYAVALSQRAPVRLVPGVSPVAAGAEVRDRYRAVPVFPG